MLFDLKGRRRRLVQATYVILAVLMGGGLVLFGIGGDVSGGLFDAFSDRQGNGGDNSALEQRAKDAEKRLAANPNDAQAAADVIRGRFTAASNDVDPETGKVGSDGQDDLAKADQAWQKYLKAVEKPEASLALVMLQVYAPEAYNKPEKAADAAEVLTEVRPTAQSYLALVEYALLANQTRKADLAAKKAVEVAPKAQKKAVEAQIKALKQASAPGGAGSTTTQP
jgi:hypothetical protein